MGSEGKGGSGYGHVSANQWVQWLPHPVLNIRLLWVLVIDKRENENRRREDQKSREIEETGKKNREMNLKMWQWWDRLEKMNEY